MLKDRLDFCMSSIDWNLHRGQEDQKFYFCNSLFLPVRVPHRWLMKDGY